MLYSLTEMRMLDKEDVAVFQKAAELGIRRTVHAGEAGPAEMVWKVRTTDQLSCKLFIPLCRNMSGDNRFKSGKDRSRLPSLGR